MRNSIIEWSWDKPTREGLYLACRGDVETEDNICFIRAKKDSMGLLIDTIGGEFIEDFDRSFKFARLCVGAEANE